MCARFPKTLTPTSPVWPSDVPGHQNQAALHAPSQKVVIPWGWVFLTSEVPLQAFTLREALAATGSDVPGDINLSREPLGAAPLTLVVMYTLTLAVTYTLTLVVTYTSR